MQKTEIGMTEIFMMVGVAIAIDIIEIALSIFSIGVGSVFSGVIQYGLYFLWFRYHGGSFFFRKRGGGIKNKNPKIIKEAKNQNMQEKDEKGLISLSWGQLFGLALESLPIIDWLPIFTYNVYSQIKAHNKEVYEIRDEQASENNNTVRLSKNSSERKAA